MTTSTSTHSFLSSLSHHAKQHHASIQSAYESYYAPGFRASSVSTPSASKPGSQRNSSVDSERSVESTAVSSSPSPSAWQKVKRHAREHHRAVNAAYGLYYGAPARV